LAIVGAVAVILLGESTIFSTVAEPVVVSVMRVDGVSPPRRHIPALYRYFVRLPTGGEARYVSQDVHHVGDQVVVLASRGLLTGRINLTKPPGDTGSVE
jgi:hypothetical protein